MKSENGYSTNAVRTKDNIKDSLNQQFGFNRMKKVLVEDSPVANRRKASVLIPCTPEAALDRIEEYKGTGLVPMSIERRRPFGGTKALSDSPTNGESTDQDSQASTGPIVSGFWLPKDSNNNNSIVQMASKSQLVPSQPLVLQRVSRPASIRSFQYIPSKQKRQSEFVSLLSDDSLDFPTNSSSPLKLPEETSENTKAKLQQLRVMFPGKSTAVLLNALRICSGNVQASTGYFTSGGSATVDLSGGSPIEPTVGLKRRRLMRKKDLVEKSVKPISFHSKQQEEEEETRFLPNTPL